VPDPLPFPIPLSTLLRAVLAFTSPVTDRIVNVPPMSNRVTQMVTFGYMLLRKEVIQPHLPVRLPCYDFVPIAGPTFDGSPSCELGHRLRVLPTFVT
jgi:hypothetical protein